MLVAYCRVEQELMARIISEMYSKVGEERKQVRQHFDFGRDTVEQDSSAAEEDGSRDGSVHDSVVGNVAVRLPSAHNCSLHC